MAMPYDRDPYDCDCCGRKCLRTHKLVAYGTDTICCDDCAGYDAEAYAEEIDWLLQQQRDALIWRNEPPLVDGE